MAVFGGRRRTVNLIALLSLIVATIGVLFTVKEFRQFLGLEDTVKIINNYTPTPTPTPFHIHKTTPTPKHQKTDSLVRQSLTQPPVQELTEPSAVKTPPAPQVEPRVFVTDSYTMRADYIHKTGSYATLPLTLDITAEKLYGFRMNGCYATDENGIRWDQKSETENRFTWGGIDMVPNTRHRTELKMATTEANDGTMFTFLCTESYPQGGRHIVIYKIPAR
jgi:hypothetical protein